MDNAVSAPRAVSVLALVGIAIWTLLSLGAWAMVGFSGDVLQAIIERLFTSDPDFGRLIGGVGRVLEGLGAGLVVFVWAIGAGIIWIGWAILRRLTSAHVVMSQTQFRTTADFDDDPTSNWAPRPMKDITPPRDSSPPQPPRALPPR